MNLSAFQPCDIRGLYGETADAQIGPRLACLVGRSLRNRTPDGQTILIAGDGRDTTPRLLAALEAGIGEGCVNLGARIPTPVTYQAKQRMGAHTAVLVTASHNPPQFNGFKIQIGDAPVTPRQIEAVRDDVAAMEDVACGEGDEDASIGAVEEGARRLRETWLAYLETLQREFEPGGGRRLAVDCMHGCYAGYAASALLRTGYTVDLLRSTVRGDFGGCTPDPAVDANLLELSELVRDGDFEFGVALDGDGDRARFLDERGALVENGTILVLLARYLLASGRAGNRTTVVYDQKMRLAVVKALREAGADPVSEKSGHAFIRARILRENALMGGEKSGHFFWGGKRLYPVDAGDCGLFAVFAVDAVLRHYGRPLSELAATVQASPFYTGDIRGLSYSGDRAELLSRLAAAVDRSVNAVSTEDGVRIERDDAFAHVRASVTETGKLTAALDAADWTSLSAMTDLVVEALPPDAQEVAETIRKRIDRLRPG